MYREVMTMKQHFLAAKIAFSIALTVGVAAMPAHAGIPVLDGTNLSQTVSTPVK